MSATELIARLPPDQLGGARVFRPCTIAGRRRNSGEEVSAADLRLIRPQNLRALMDQRFIVAYPVGAVADPEDGEVFVYNRVGTSRYDVIIGRRLNASPLTKDEADQLVEKHRQP